MYLPYFRGKAAECLAIRAVGPRFDGNILPIVEPVVKSKLKSFLEQVKNLKTPIIVVVNPRCGDFSEDPESLVEVLDDYVVWNQRAHFGILINSSTTSQFVQEAISRYPNCRWTFIHRDRNSNSSQIATIFQSLQSQGYNVLEERLGPSYHNRFEQRVLFSDRFNKQARNADYAENIDEFFSDYGPAYMERPPSYEGFGDFSIIGDYFSTEGYSPWAIAIHIIYEHVEDASLWVRHAVSSVGHEVPPNQDQIIAEALEALHDWVESSQPNLRSLGEGLDDLCIMHEEGSTTNLLTLKRYAIQHHLELMCSLFP